MSGTFTAVGALAGVAWAAALRGYMWHISGTPHVEWAGTFLAILLPGAVTGGLLGLAWARWRAGPARGLGWFALAPLAFAIAPLLLPGALVTFLTTGIGGGAIGVAAVAIGGGFALGQVGPRWARIASGAVSLALIVAITATVPLLGGLALTDAEGAWVGVLVASLLLLLAIATSIPFRREPSRRIRPTVEASESHPRHS